MKVELAFDIVQDGFLRVKGQVCEYDDTFGAEMMKAGHFERLPGTPSRKNSALYSIGCLPNPVVKNEEVQKENVNNLERKKINNYGNDGRSKHQTT